MESKEEEYTESPPSYQATTQHPTAYHVSEPTPYPAPGSQYQYPPPPSQYPPPAQPYPGQYGQSYAYGQSVDEYSPPQPEYGTPQYAASGPQQVVMVGAGQQHYQPASYVASYIGHIIFSCIVFWCCNCLFGLIAFVLASQYDSATTFCRDGKIFFILPATVRP